MQVARQEGGRAVANRRKAVRIPGVGDASLFGTQNYAMGIWVKPGLLSAQQQELLAQYSKTVQASFAEVENAPIRIRRAAAQHATQAAQVASTERTLALAQTRYRNGYSSFLEVLDAQRNLFTAELAQVQARETQLTPLVTLYRALGGGWDPAAIAAEAEPPRSQQPGERRVQQQ